jgi:excisionase family DNA binding protein
MERQVFDVVGAAEYLRSLGVVSATKNTVRALIADKRLRAELIGRRFYVSREALDGLVARLNRPEIRSRTA